jgi:cation transport regulator ChaB
MSPTPPRTAKKALGIGPSIAAEKEDGNANDNNKARETTATAMTAATGTIIPKATSKANASPPAKAAVPSIARTSAILASKPKSLIACFLCRRKFFSEELLRTHLGRSELHRKNLANFYLAQHQLTQHSQLLDVAALMQQQQQQQQELQSRRADAAAVNAAAPVASSKSKNKKAGARFEDSSDDSLGLSFKKNKKKRTKTVIREEEDDDEEAGPTRKSVAVAPSRSSTSTPSNTGSSSSNKKIKHRASLNNLVVGCVPQDESLVRPDVWFTCQNIELVLKKDVNSNLSDRARGKGVSHSENATVVYDMASASASSNKGTGTSSNVAGPSNNNNREAALEVFVDPKTAVTYFQVGFQCRPCAAAAASNATNVAASVGGAGAASASVAPSLPAGARYFPRRVSSLVSHVNNIVTRHFDSCPHLSTEWARLNQLKKEGVPGTKKPAGQWGLSAMLASIADQRYQLRDYLIKYDENENGNENNSVHALYISKEVYDKAARSDQIVFDPMVQQSAKLHQHNIDSTSMTIKKKKKKVTSAGKLSTVSQEDEANDNVKEVGQESTTAVAVTAAASYSPSHASQQLQYFSLYHPDDETHLSRVHRYLRKRCMEAFLASSDDVASANIFNQKDPNFVGQVGVRCSFCRGGGGGGSDAPDTSNTNNAVKGTVFPRRTTMLYDAAALLLRKHFLSDECQNIPKKKSVKLKSLKRLSDNSNIHNTGSTSTSLDRLEYFAEKAEEYGIQNATNGLVWQPPSVEDEEQDEEKDSKVKASTLKMMTKHKAKEKDKDSAMVVDLAITSHEEQDNKDLDHRNSPVAESSQGVVIAMPSVATASDQSSSAVIPTSSSDAATSPRIDQPRPLLSKGDDKLSTRYMYRLLEQAFSFPPKDKDKRGLCDIVCLHCARGLDISPKEFKTARYPIRTPNELKIAINNHLSKHLLVKCPYLPQPIEEELIELKKAHYREVSNESTADKLETFFGKLWDRLEAHYNIKKKLISSVKKATATAGSSRPISPNPGGLGRKHRKSAPY